MFRHAIKELRTRFRCVAVDMPGLGLSTAPAAHGKSFERNSHYYRRFVEMLNLGDFVLIAHATAGPPALRMAIAERDRVAGMVITSSFAWSMRPFPAMWRFVRIVNSVPFRLLNETLNLLPRLTARIARTTGKFTDDEKRAILSPYRHRAARRHLTSLLHGLKAEIPFFDKLESDLVELRDVPVLFLYGVKDNGYRAGFLDRWKQLLPNHTVKLLHDSSHFPPEDEPEAYTDGLREWLDGKMMTRHDRRLRAQGE
jgi:haloalkane dehalogenase